LRTRWLITVLVLASVAYFFQGGGWNQNAHFATAVALVDDGTVAIDRYKDSTGDVSNADGHIYSVKAIGTALACTPGYLIARTLTVGIDNVGNRAIARAYLTTVLGPGVALALFALVLLRCLERRLNDRDAMVVTLAVTLATPLFPNSTMVTPTPFVALFALLAYDLLEEARLGLRPWSRLRLVGAGAAAGLPACFEYTTALVVLPLGLYALWYLPRRGQIAWMVLGGVLAALVPMAHHTAAYGGPFTVGYETMALPGLADTVAHGFFGFDGFSMDRLYDLTLGNTRGYLFLSPFLAAAIPGSVRLLKGVETRPEGLVTAAIAYGFLLLVASLAYWHSGWGLGSRYALLFVVFAAIPVAAIYPHHRLWVGVGILVAFFTMTLAVAVTATPPPPARHPVRPIVTQWLWEQLVQDKVAFRNELVLAEVGRGDGMPTWRASFNLGQAAGLAGKVSILPWLLGVLALFLALWRQTGPGHERHPRRLEQPMSAASTQERRTP
jgi:hypothetical protein